jgi:hypothetical protein
MWITTEANQYGSPTVSLIERIQQLCQISSRRLEHSSDLMLQTMANLVTADLRRLCLRKHRKFPVLGDALDLYRELESEYESKLAELSCRGKRRMLYGKLAIVCKKLGKNEESALLSEDYYSKGQAASIGSAGFWSLFGYGN